MNTARVAAALNTISLAFGELAEALNDAPQAHHNVPEVFEPQRTTLTAGTVNTTTYASEPSPFIDLPDEVFAAPAGSLAVCPKHHIPYTEGQYGKFCKSTTDDPAWGKQKGDKLWCKITPANAADWLRITAAA